MKFIAKTDFLHFLLENMKTKRNLEIRSQAFFIQKVNKNNLINLLETLRIIG
jgi:hypothetical protein